MNKFINDADELHFHYSRAELKAELEKRTLGTKSNKEFLHIDTQTIKKALEIYGEEDNVTVEMLCVFSDLEYLKRLLKIRNNPEVFSQFAKQDEVDSKFDAETMEKAIQHYYDEKYVAKRKGYAQYDE